MIKVIAIVVVSVLVGFYAGYYLVDNKYTEFTEFIFSQDRKEKILGTINLLNALNNGGVDEVTLLLKKQFENSVVSTKALSPEYFKLIEKDLSHAIANSSSICNMYRLNGKDCTLDEIIVAIQRQSEAYRK
jgi:hypothetical protein